MHLGDGHHDGATGWRTRVTRATPRLAGAAVAIVSCLAVALTLSSPVGGSAGRAGVELKPVAKTTDADPIGTPIKVIQANIEKDMGHGKFLADVESVMAEQPDIITYNEVHRRADADLLRPGYAMFRTPGPRTGWAPVAWDAAKWTAIDQGTVQISKRPERYNSGMLGVRYANWVTLADRQGQVLSVVSTHIAPNSKQTAELLVPSLKVLKRLASQLSEAGPVIIGGDFNMGYRSDRYQPKRLQKVGLESNFDLLGTIFSTHRRGGIIDYVFLGPSPELTIESHRPIALKSDHSAVVAELRFTPAAPQEPLPTFEPSKLVIPGDASKKERRAIRRKQLRAIRATQPGEAIHVATADLRGKLLHEALIKAHERGVKLTMLVGSPKLPKRSKQLRRMLGTDVHQQSWFRRDKKAWRKISGRTVNGVEVKALKPTELLISRAGATPAYTLRANTAMNKVALKKGYRKKARARVRVRLDKYDTYYRQYLAQVGRSY